MKDGVLQQLDTPENLHERPVNAFVAGFIGSPAMNFFEGKIHQNGGGPVADAGFFSAPVRGEAAAASGKAVTIGIRPEDIEDLAHAGGRELVPVDTKVEVVEFLGNELQLELSAGGQNFVARVSTETQAKPGDTLRVGLNLRKMHIFDKQSEMALR
jgi:multiple sugar transport system ATP-binding protein